MGLHAAAVRDGVRGWYLLGILLMAVTASAQLAAPNRRERGGPLGLSIQNEVDAAQQRARDWLVAAQHPAGDWDATNRCGATAIALVALCSGDAPPAASVARAASWLAARAPAELATCSIETRAWRLLALALTANTPDRLAAEATSLATELQRRPATDSSPIVWTTLQMALAAAPSASFPVRSPAVAPPAATNWVERCAWAMPPDNARREPEVARQARGALVDALAAHWAQSGPPHDARWSDNRQRWLLARFINRAASGVLAAPATASATASARIDWRSDLANDVVATQRVDPLHAGTGFWTGRPACPDWAADPVVETAFGLLALGEL